LPAFDHDRARWKSRNHNNLLARVRTPFHVKLGLIEWPELVALIDVLLGAIWIDVTANVRAQLFDRVADDQGLNPKLRDLVWWGDDYGSLLIMAWIFDGWPDRMSAALALLRASRFDVLLDRRPDIAPTLRAQVGRRFADEPALAESRL